MSHPIPPPPAPGPPRTVTVPVKPKQPHVPQPSHRSHHHHLRDKSVPQSATLPNSSNPFSSSNISSPLSDLLSPITKSVTKHDTPLDVLKNREDEAKDAEAKAKEESERQRKIWAEIEKRRSRRKVPEESLLSDLSSLSTLSTSTTRRLDYTYYSLLSHLSSLTSTLAALSALSAASTSIHSSFSDTAQQMEREIRGQVQTFNSMTFEAQRERAELLEKRMKGARKKVEMLNGRMEHVRNKIEDFEQKENNARRRVRFTVRCVWGLSGMLIAVFALLFIAKHWSHVKNSLDGVDIGSLGHAALDVKPFPQTPEPLQSGREAEPPGDSAYVPAGWENGLRMLDEL